jgi:hypothetical protein
MRRKFWFLTGTGALALPLVVVAAAFACGSLATLKLNRATATPGAQVVAVGGNYNTSPQASPVQLRFNGRNGPVLWEGRPTRSGRITAPFVFPRVRAGAYVILATQTGPDGRPAAGTPGRAPLRGRAAARAETPVAAWPSARDGGPAAPQGAPVSTPVLAGAALLALGLLGTGVAVLRPRARRGAVRPARTTA